MMPRALLILLLIFGFGLSSAQAQNYVRVEKNDKAEQTTVPAPAIDKTLHIARKQPLYFFSDFGLTYGARLLAEGKYASALESFQRVLDVNPRNIDALAGKGAAYLGMGRMQQAGDHIRRALSRDNKHVGANYLYGRYYIMTDRIDLALDQLTVLNLLCGTRYKCVEALALEGDLNAARK